MGRRHLKRDEWKNANYPRRIHGGYDGEYAGRNWRNWEMITGMDFTAVQCDD